MVQTRGRPTLGEWLAIKDEFEQIYMSDNMTLKTTKEHFARRGFIATDRQYKSKVKLWDLDCKKIKGALWQSMNVVMNHRKSRGLSSKFLVPIRDNDIEVITPSRVKKQIRRDKTVWDWKNLALAEQTLEKRGVRVITGDEELPLHVGSPGSRGLHRSPGFVSRAQSQNAGSVIRYQNTGDHSSLSPRYQSGLVPWQPLNEALYGQTPTTFEGQTMTLPVASPTWTAPSGHPEHHHSERPWPGPEQSVNPSQPAVAPSDFEITTDMQSLFIHPAFDESTRRWTEPQIHINLKLIPYMSEEKQCAVQWIAPYIQAFTRPKDIPIEVSWNVERRTRAKEAFRTMLEKSNKFIYPYCNWMVTVLLSNNQTVLFSEFLTDCCEVLDCSKRYQLTYGDPLHLALALYTENEKETENYRTRFLQSANVIRMIYGDDSPNYLINQYYMAWLKLDDKQYGEGLDLLRWCFPVAERTMGPEHVVTVNCLAMLARGLQESGQLADAAAVFNNVLNRLANCAELLRAYYHRQLMRLAQLQIEMGNTYEAELNIRTVVKFRIHKFRLDSPCTWAAIKVLVDLLSNQERIKESSSILRQCTDGYYQQLEDEWPTRYNEPVPWKRKRSY